MAQKSMTEIDTNSNKSYEGLSLGISDLINNLNYINKLFNTVTSKIQNSWNSNLKSRYVNLSLLNETDINILTSALPEIEALILEKFRVSWLNFETRFQHQITNSDYKSFYMILVNIEKQLLSFDSLYNDTCDSLNNDEIDRFEYERKSYHQFIINNDLNVNKTISNRIMLPKR